MTDDELREFLALAALDALGDDEQHAIDTAISERPDLQAELDELRAAASQLAETVATSPPPETKASILAQIDALQRTGTGDVTGARTSRDDSSTTPPKVPRLGHSRQQSPSRVKALSRRRRWTAGIAAAGASVAAIGVTIWIASDSSPNDADRADAVLDLPDIEALELHGEMEGVRIIHSPSSTAAVLLADDMPDPGADLTYQLWFSRDGIITPANVFRPDRDGHVEVLLENFQPAGAVIAVTIEPADGSDQPTSPTLVSSD